MMALLFVAIIPLGILNALQGSVNMALAAAQLGFLCIGEIIQWQLTKNNHAALRIVCFIITYISLNLSFPAVIFGICSFGTDNFLTGIFLSLFALCPAVIIISMIRVSGSCR